MKEPEEQYLSYLLRLWQSQRNGELIWRASLESSQTGQRHLFATLEELCAFLQETTRATAHHEE
jgi:hypothetical protein